MREVIDALPEKPKKNRGVKVKAQRRLSELLHYLIWYGRLDEDRDNGLSKAECAKAPQSQLDTRAGGSLTDRFDQITGGTRLMNFEDFYAHVILVDGEGIPPVPQPEPQLYLEPQPQTPRTHDGVTAAQAAGSEDSRHRKARSPSVEAVIKRADAILAASEAQLAMSTGTAASLDSLVAAMRSHGGDVEVQYCCTAALEKLAASEEQR
eukprot:COSAG02_NODE_13595_length_1374_cov_246.955294_2_plen_207_part_01